MMALTLTRRAQITINNTLPIVISIILGVSVLSFLIIIFIIIRRKRAQKQRDDEEKQQSQKYQVIDEEQARHRLAMSEYRQVQQEEAGVVLGERAAVSQGGAEQTQTRVLNAPAMATCDGRPVERSEQSLRK